MPQVSPLFNILKMVSIFERVFGSVGCGLRLAIRVLKPRKEGRKEFRVDLFNALERYSSEEQVYIFLISIHTQPSSVQAMKTNALHNIITRVQALLMETSRGCDFFSLF